MKSHQERKNWTFSRFENVNLPVSVFNNDSLSALETITKYLKEEFGLILSEIAFLLNRDDRTIWGAYNSAIEKMPCRLSTDISKFSIPAAILQNRNLSVLEAIVGYLKDDIGLRYCQISTFMNRDARTVWTVYNRAKKKRKKFNAA